MTKQPLAQSRKASLVEALANTCIGLVVGYLTNMTVLPYYGFEVTSTQAVEITTIFTVVSITRGYLARRGFNWLWLKGWLR